MSSGKYRSSGFKVPRRRHDEVKATAQELIDSIQENYGWETSPFPGIRLIEVWGSMHEDDNDHPNYEVVKDKELVDGDGAFVPDRKLFVFPESVWNAASDSDPSANETIVHEISHYILRLHILAHSDH